MRLIDRMTLLQCALYGVLAGARTYCEVTMSKRRNGPGWEKIEQIERLIAQVLPVFEQLIIHRTGPGDVLDLLNLRHAMKEEGFSTDAIDRRIRATVDALAGVAVGAERSS